MQYMDKEELEISQIQNITNIKVYDLVMPNNSGEDAIVFGLMVFYDGKVLNYCEMDTVFEKFKQKVFSQYRREYKNNRISMDEATKVFMNSEKAKEVPVSIKPYLDSKYYEYPLINYGVKDFKKFEGTFRYHIITMLKYLEKQPNLGNISGYRESLFISDKDQDEKGISINVVDIEDDFVELEIGGILDNINFIKVYIRFNSDNITVSISSDNKSISMNFEYKLKEDGIHQEISVFSNGQYSYYDNSVDDKKISEEELKNVNRTLNNDNSFSKYDSGYTLPWGAYYMQKEECKPIHDKYDISKRNSAYVEYNSDYIGIMSFSENICINSVGHRMRINGGKKKTDIFKVNGTNYGIVQTHFGNLPYSNGLYKANLSDKYFYAITEGDDFVLPTQVSLYRINKDSDIELGYQLFEINEIEKVKGR